MSLYILLYDVLSPGEQIMADKAGIQNKLISELKVSELGALFSIMGAPKILPVPSTEVMTLRALVSRSDSKVAETLSRQSKP